MSVQNQLGKIEPLVNLIRKGNVGERLKAIDELAILGRIAASALPALFEPLSDPNEDVRAAAVWAIREIGLGDEAMSPAFLALLHDSRTFVRLSALSSVRGLCQKNGALACELIKLLDDPDPQVRSLAGWKLLEAPKEVLTSVFSERGGSRPRWLPLLGAADPAWRASAAIALSLHGSVASLDLLHLLEDPCAIVRRAIAISTRWLASPGVALDAALRNSDVDVRRFATRVLCLAPSDEAAERIVDILQDESAEVRYDALLSLGRMGTHALGKLGALCAAFSDPEPLVRCGAATAIGEIGTAPSEVLAALVRTLKDPISFVRRACTVAVGRLAPPSLEVFLTLSENLDDSDEEIRYWTQSALKAISQSIEDPQGLSDVLSRCLKNQRKDTRLFVIDLLVELGAGAKGAVHSLASNLLDGAAEVRCSAAHALGRIGADAKEAIPWLIRALRDEYAEVRSASAVALGRIGSNSFGSGSALCVALADPEPEVQFFAAQAITAIDASEEIQVPCLVEALKGNLNSEIRLLAARALGKLEGKGTLPERALSKALLKESEPRVKREIVESLDRVQRRRGGRGHS